MIKGSKYSEDAKKRMSEIKKGKHYSPRTEFKMGHKPYWKIDYSEEWRKKVSKGWFGKGSVPWNKGKRMSVETKRKLGEALMGHEPWNRGKEMPGETKKELSKLFEGKHRSPKTEFKKGQYKGDKNPAKGIEIRRKISKAKRGKPLFNMRGENHPRWSGGNASMNERLRRRIEYKLWRKAVFVRDNWTCQKCGEKGGKLNVHHLYNFADYPDLQTLIKNGITLCKKCHREFHRIHGIKNNTKTKLEKFINTLNYIKN